MNEIETTPAKRADAERNRSRILHEARAAFGEAGEEPSMAEIARRAGVGMATLYRNFPSRLDLIAELYRNQVNEICAAAVAADGPTAGAAFFSWLESFHGAGTRKGALATLLLSEAGSGASVVNENRDRVLAAAAPLLAAAQESGEVKQGLPVGLVLDAVVAVGRITADPEERRRIVEVVFDGLRATRS